MASGYGNGGGPGRCYGFWLDFSKCVSNADEPTVCKDFRDDYIECLHHRKELTRLAEVAKEAERQKKDEDAAQTAGPAPN